MKHSFTPESYQRLLEGQKRSQAITQQKKIARIAAYQQTPTLCHSCGLPLNYERRANKFCSSSCAAIFNNPRKPRRKPRCYCLHCAKQLTSSAKKYCNTSCQALHQWDLHKQRVDAAGGFASGTNRQTIRRYLIETRGHRCEMCKLQLWNDQPVPLVADHTNGNPYDDSLTNLRLLCCNCDAQTPTYKGRNRGNGRHVRRQRYAAGKSF